MGKIKKSLIYFKFNPFNTDTFYAPLRVCINGFRLQCIWRPNLLILYLFVLLADVAFEQAGMRFLEFFHDVSLSVTSV